MPLSGQACYASRSTSWPKGCGRLPLEKATQSAGKCFPKSKRIVGEAAPRSRQGMDDGCKG